jgi:hypothetical protein
MLRSKFKDGLHNKSMGNLFDIFYVETTSLEIVQSIYARKRRDLEQIATEGFLGSS